LAVASSVKMTAIAGLSLALAACVSQQEKTSGNVRVINDNPGGVLVNYAITRLDLQERGSQVRFAGYCDSACTLLLALPNNKLCVEPSASFGFHRPYGSTKRGNKEAERYLVSQYPEWVKTWISSQGGLQDEINRMPFEKVSAHIRPCPTKSSSR